MGQLGIVRQRQAAILGIARAVAEQRLALHPGADVPATLATLKELPGIGDWTAQYIAMRALRWPDAFPAAAQSPGRSGQPTSGPRGRSRRPGLEALAQLCRDPRLVHSGRYPTEAPHCPTRRSPMKAHR